MPVASHRSIIAFWLVLGLAPQAFAQDLCLIPEPPPEPPPQPLADDAISDETLEIITSRIDGVSDSEAVLADVEIRYGDGTLTAQSASLDPNGNVDLLGRVEVMDAGVTVFGEDAHYDPDTERISLSAVPAGMVPARVTGKR